MNGCQSCERTMKYKDGPKVYKSHMPFCFEFQVWRSELETKTRRPWKGIGLHRPWPPHSVGVRWSYVSWFRLRARGVELCFIVVWIPDCDRALLLLPSDTTGHWWRTLYFFFGLSLVRQMTPHLTVANLRLNMARFLPLHWKHAVTCHCATSIDHWWPPYFSVIVPPSQKLLRPDRMLTCGWRRTLGWEIPF